jgi:hypothetical protein
MINNSIHRVPVVVSDMAVGVVVEWLVVVLIFLLRLSDVMNT